MLHQIKQIFRSPKFVVGFCIFMFMLLFSWIYPAISPYGPQQMVGNIFYPPGKYVSVTDTANSSKKVTFDVDANGIVNVTAKDLGTGKSTNITITASTNLSEEDIDKAVKDAEKYAEEDKKRKEAIDNKNTLESMIDNLEKTVKDAGDKLSDDDKKVVEDAVAKAKTELESNDNDRIKNAIETLSKDIQPVIAKIYQQAGGAQGGNPDGGDGDTEFNQHK